MITGVVMPMDTLLEGEGVAVGVETAVVGGNMQVLSTRISPSRHPHMYEPMVLIQNIFGHKSFPFIAACSHSFISVEKKKEKERTTCFSLHEWLVI